MRTDQLEQLDRLWQLVPQDPPEVDTIHPDDVKAEMVDGPDGGNA